MTDRERIDFLQWALPRLGLRWPGFRMVRRQMGGSSRNSQLKDSLRWAVCGIIL